ncbi:hypothetical protein BN2476_2140001 [Paraburkholderia piptadeniae]|uniref:Uncharacterized protein n=1 Tax=Paraburkholderia piptadeniae TaxID=1701573 RepID=A0A1N7SXP0_9BURK|nr:hypothetical protein BN2476_2140001 [Paraburkholderia piptadeniae]
MRRWHYATKTSHGGLSGLTQIASLEHEAIRLHPAVDFVITARETDAFDFRAPSSA